MTNLIAAPGQLQACILRVARLGADCVPLSGANDIITTAGMVSVAATAESEEATNFEQKNGCGAVAWQAEEGCAVLRRYTLAMELATFDYELLEILTGGSLILGGDDAPEEWQGKVIGFADPGADTSCPNGVSLEVFTKATYNTGSCSPVGSGKPLFVRHIFPRAFFIPGDRTFENDVATASLSGTATPNAAWGQGSTADWISAANLAADTPHAQMFAPSLPTPNNQGLLGQLGGGYAGA